MRFALQRIEAEDSLACLFNAYTKGLSTINILSAPRESMRECRHAFLLEESSLDDPDLSIRASAQRFYELTVLNNALLGIHNSVMEGINLLQGFFTAYGDNLTRYAIERRLASIREYGSSEDSDWEWDGIGNQEEPESWKVAYKDDPESLQSYSLYSDLGRCFQGHETRGEYIGTSSPEDFRLFSTLVQHESDFSFRKMFAAVGGVNVSEYGEQADGQLVPMSLGDQVEQELNQDIRNESLVARFEHVLTLGQQAVAFYRRMHHDNITDYRKLLQLLVAMRDITSIR